MERFCDLHTHSMASDGTDSPRELVFAAKNAGLFAVALCDHNTVAGLSQFTEACIEAGIDAVPGIEFSTDYEGKELHILALFVKNEHYGKINDLLEDVKKRKEAANIALARSLSAAGYEIDYDEIKEKSGGYVNRAHFATEMMEKGYAPSVREAFDTYLVESAGFYKSPGRLLAIDVIKFIRSIGAAPVLAHPFLNLTEEELREFLPVAKEAGLCAMETDYATYSEETAVLAREIADSFEILRSGGSDYHGERKPDIAIGRGRGNLRVPYSYLDAMKKEII